MKMVLVSVGLVLVVRAAVGQPNAPDYYKQTRPYKKVDDVWIRADIYRRDDMQVQPVLVWIHGGALITGSRSEVPRELLKLCRDENYILVSIDYRLAPEVKLPAIAEDVVDAISWIRKAGPGFFQADPERLVIAGGSAGGYLTMLAGIKVKPAPSALVAYWGYGDVDGDWLTKPSAYYRNNFQILDKDDALRIVGKQVLTGTDRFKAEHKDRGMFYHYLRQNGLWTKSVTGFDTIEKMKLDLYCPVRNITAKYPPLLMLHGTKDDDVPYEQSAEMARELARHGAWHELITVPGAGHGLAGGKRALIDKANRRAFEFIRAHMVKKK